MLLTTVFTNEELCRITQQKWTENQIKTRKWNWIGRTLRKEAGTTEKTVLDWNPQGYRRGRRPKSTWRRKTEDEIRGTGRSWNEVKRIAGDRKAWKLFMDALCCTRSNRTWWRWRWWWWITMLYQSNKQLKCWNGFQSSLSTFFPWTRDLGQTAKILGHIHFTLHTAHYQYLCCLMHSTHHHHKHIFSTHYDTKPNVHTWRNPSVAAANVRDFLVPFLERQPCSSLLCVTMTYENIMCEDLSLAGCDHIALNDCNDVE
jgi:hypothetical protein